MNGQVKVVDAEKEFQGKMVLVRIDSDIDLENGIILDDTRLSSCLQTIHYIINEGGVVILIGHLGRPDKKFSIINFQLSISERSEFSLLPIAKWFEKKFGGGISEQTIGGFPGWKITDHLFLLENIRFFQGEEENDPNFAKTLSSLGNIFVDEAFAVSHRNHASNVGITKFLPSYSGFHFAKEVEVLSAIMQNPKWPLVVIIGGAKIETKLPMVERMHLVADYVLVGGEIAEQDKILIRVQHEKIQEKKSVVLVADMKEDQLDITDKSAENFIQIINMGETIVWNGPVGLIGKEEIHEAGTRKIAYAIVESQAYKIVGGGDTLAFLRKLNLLPLFDFVSTGGGAMLEFLAGKELPAITPLLK